MPNKSCIASIKLGDLLYLKKKDEDPVFVAEVLGSYRGTPVLGSFTYDGLTADKVWFLLNQLVEDSKYCWFNILKPHWIIVKIVKYQPSK